MVSVRRAIARGPRLPNISARLEVVTGLRPLRAARARRRYGPELARHVPDGLALGTVRRTVNGVALAPAGPVGEPPTVLVKLGTNPGSDGVLSRSINVAAAIAAEPRIAGWRLGPPRILASGVTDGHPWLVESVLRGVPASELIARGQDRDRIERLALAQIEAFHRCASGLVVVGDELLARWVGGPAEQVLPLVSASAAHTRALRELERRLEAALGGRELAVGWVHGDFAPENVLMDSQGTEVTGIVDWELAVPDGLCCLDQVLFLLTVHSRVAGLELGQLVAELVTGRGPDRFEATLGRIRCSPRGGPDPAALVLLCWLQHVAATANKSPATARHPIWARYNLRVVLDAPRTKGSAVTSLDRPMQTLTYLPRLAAIGGVEVHMLQLTRELARRGWRVDLYFTEDGDLHEGFESSCASLVQSPFIRYRGSPAADLRRIVPSIRPAVRSQPEVLYLNNFTELGWGTAVKMITRAPIVCHLHLFTPVGRPSIAVFGSQVRRFIVASDFMRATWTRHGLAPERIETIPYGIDLSDYPRGTDADRIQSREALGLPADAYVVLYLGRIDAEKGVEVLLSAWREFGAPPDEARLLLVGSPVLHPDPAAYLRQLQAHAPPGCHWLPMRPDVVPMMHAADVLVLPSVWEEPFGRVIIETMATGRPVVASDCGGIPEILDGRFAQFLFPRGDEKSLAGRLGALSRWRKERPELADQCVDHVAARYRLEQTAGRVEAVLREAAGG